MQRLPLSKLGARTDSKNPLIIDLGLFLPEFVTSEGYQVWVKVIHEHDQFLQEIQPEEFELKLDPLAPQNYANCLEYWSGQVNLKDAKNSNSDSRFGKKGKYLYRYCLKHPERREEIDWIIDPFGREFGMGKLSAFTVGEEEYQWSKHEEKEWKTPALNDLIIYEMMISEFGNNLKETINRLDYLADLGVNCIKIMPISNIVNTIDWGYKPIGYFGVDDRFGKSKQLKKLIDEAHQRKIAVILDVVYAHTEEHFAYCYLYRKLGKPNPLMGKFGNMDGFGKDDECTNFNHPFIQDFFFTVNCHLLEEYHVDGFRYDFVPGYWDGAEGNGYANLTHKTYQEVKSKANIVQQKQQNWKDWQRFFNNDTINLIQCAEQLQDPKGVLHQTYSNCTWQNQTLDKSKNVAKGEYDLLDSLALSYSLYDYPSQVTNESDTQIKTAFQYIETHDHSRFLCNWGCKPCQNEHFLQEGDRQKNWFKVQPYLMGMLTAKGIPLLWQGQEFAENYYIPPEGAIRVMLFRPVRWDYFYDEIGRTMIGLIRKLIKIRREQPQFRSLKDDSYYFHNHYDHYQSHGILILSRKHENHASLIALNFSDEEHTVKFGFSPEHFPIPENGKVTFQEQLHGEKDLKDIFVGEEYDLTIPSNYGRIWTLS